MIGYVQVYTGNGKGKTTCALGLTLRAVGAGKKVYFGQFVKSGEYSELKAIHQYLPGVTVAQFGSGFIFGNPTEAHRAEAAVGLQQAAAALLSGDYDVVIFDEINVAVSLGLVSEEAVLALLRDKPAHCELVLTGRGAGAAVLEKADLVTEMGEVKHYYHQGVPGREGIES